MNEFFSSSISDTIKFHECNEHQFGYLSTPFIKDVNYPTFFIIGKYLEVGIVGNGLA